VWSVGSRSFNREKSSAQKGRVMKPEENERITQSLPIGLWIALLIGLAVWSTAVVGWAEETGDSHKVLAKDNLVAWCVVPFDAAQRGPIERAEMLQRLGLKKLAYDWRAQHVPTFEQEIIALKKHGIEFTAFWGAHEDMFRLFQKHNITPQVWITAPSPSGDSQDKRVVDAAESLLPLVKRTAELGCDLGLYNHGGWGGEPENLVAVCRHLRENAAADHVGIVYNMHHGHGHIADFAESLALMKPYLLCLNLNGMNTAANPKILPLGQGQHDLVLLRALRDSGYNGLVGILDHRNDTDAEQSLRENLSGLRELRRDL
jgi:sugar phosphate isomerase/epimerase